jgi:hypothetical protein
MIDAAGKDVIEFASKLLNASAAGLYADSLATMYASRSWRRYEDALGVTSWRAHEFDYFLIACGARHGDVVRVLQWDTVRAAALTMGGPSSKDRRPFSEAVQAWRSAGPESLEDLARTNGWCYAQPTQALKIKQALPERARFLRRHGMPKDVGTARRRAQQITSPRRAELKQFAHDIASRVSGPAELRYLIELLRHAASAASNGHIRQ